MLQSYNNQIRVPDIKIDNRDQWIKVESSENNKCSHYFQQGFHDHSMNETVFSINSAGKINEFGTLLKIIYKKFSIF